MGAENFQLAPIPAQFCQEMTLIVLVNVLFKISVVISPTEQLPMGSSFELWLSERACSDEFHLNIEWTKRENLRNSAKKN